MPKRPAGGPGAEVHETEAVVMRGVASRMEPPLSCSAQASEKEVMWMSRNTRQTGVKAAKAASKTLSNPKSPKAAKTAAASALSQTPKRRGK